MTPLRLRLSNFLSYGESSEPIDFDGFHVACLCGPNGHGKSALLDGITWALWGQARSNSADDLVRLGQANMQVEFEFLLDRQQYRVTRKRARGRTSQSDLQFQVRGEGDDWRALTGQGVRETQARINQTLRMDYDTFINSAFILQGRADEFARKSAGDRKKILGEILNLRVYDELTESARAQRAEAQMAGRAVDAQLAEMERERARETERRLEVERLTALQSEARTAVELGRAQLQEAVAERSRLAEIRRNRDAIQARVESSERELLQQRALLLEFEGKGVAHRATLERAGEIRNRAQELYALRAESESLAAQLEQVRVLEAERNQQEQRLQVERGRLSTELQLARQRARDLRAKVAPAAAVRADVAGLERQAEVLDRYQAEQGEIQSRLAELAAERARFAGEGRRCAEDLEKAEERFRLLKSATAQCPLCSGPLPEEKRRDLGWQLRKERDDLKLAQGRAIQAEADARRLEAESSRRLQDLAGQIRTGQIMRDRLAQARQQLLQIEEAERCLPGEEEIAANLEAQLAAEEFAPETRQALAELEARIRVLGYDEGHRRKLQSRIEELTGAERELQSLETAEAELPILERQAEAMAAGIRTREEAIAGDLAARAGADAELDGETAAEERVRELEGGVAQLEGAEREISRGLGIATDALARCLALVPEIREKKAQRDAARRDESAYEELSKAFGRNGIQALIIENALPEIETEANQVLGRMSEGQLAVRLKTQRELRTGSQAETLEIEISDGIGPRRYELYSGGEAFRVNFALRIALSKLLARRAGARLETLFIDEGFGSQDQEGRQRLVEAIHAVQEDFSKILVITHLDELKDAFPTRIEVTKGAAGTQVAVY